jgi:hypothetical protein
LRSSPQPESADYLRPSDWISVHAGGTGFHYWRASRVDTVPVIVNINQLKLEMETAVEGELFQL